MYNYLYIDKENVKHNIKLARGNKQVCLMVKANTYGLGDSALQMLIDMGYKYFGVSTIEEALKVRSMCSDARILICSYILAEDIETCIDNNIEFTVYNDTLLERITNGCKYHLKVDTNMGRLGFQMDSLDKLALKLDKIPVKPIGIFSHLACAADEEKTAIAISNFEAALDKFKHIDFELIHLFNSYGSVNYDTKFDNMVRIGIGMWGYFANTDEMNSSKQKWKPALKMDLAVSHVKEYSGDVSYDHLDYVDGTLYTVPIGYHDGVMRAMRGYYIRDIGYIRGNVNMCQMLVEADSTTQILKMDDTFTFYDGNQLYDVCNYAQITIYEYLVNLSNRIARVIIK